ncbi:transcription factor 19 isoform X2 [Nematostella vectensis]|uniref:transcription factor 19 isoform X2 n=1 Tax=Nematostella vectensis TaxID=45351 RepID=UPI0020775AA2|nr:transcription factor 19 isoform X2 [Nematostella vectensis]
MKENSEFCLRRIGAPPSFPGIRDVFSLSEGVNIVGRNPGKSDVYLDSMKHKALISRLHARIIYTTDNDTEKLTICDTSLNGTFVNDRKIIDTVGVKLGDVVTFGHLRGAVLAPGTVAKQPDSEFRFKLDRLYLRPNNTSNCRQNQQHVQPNQQSSKGSPKTDQSPLKKPLFEALIPDLSPLLKHQTSSKHTTPRSSPSGQHKCITPTHDSPSIMSISSTLESSQCSEDDELLAFAVAAGNAMEDESDEELFSVDIPSKMSITNSRGNTKSESRIRDDPNRLLSPMSEKSFSNDDKSRNKQGKAPKRTRRKTFPGHRRQSKKAKQTVEESVDKCAAKCCLQPQEECVTWVQCDFCQQWYHVLCAGVAPQDVDNSQVLFDCGCNE